MRQIHVAGHLGAELIGSALVVAPIDFYRLTQELNEITDEHVVRDLRNADRRKGYWIDEDPTLERMLGWIRMQR